MKHSSLAIALTSLTLISCAAQTEPDVVDKETPSVADTATSSASDDSQASGVVPVDDTWNKYINRQLGFSINIPKTVSVGTGKPAAELVPFEYPAERMVFLAATHFYPNGSDERQETTLELLMSETATDFPPAWAIFADAVNDDAELELTLKNTFGPGCAVGEKKETEQEGVFNITMKGDGKPLDETLCPGLMANPFIRYSSVQKQVVYWGLSQGVQFVEGDNEGSQAYDIEMLNSFRFE